MPNIGFPELIVIALLAILFFGKDRLPDLAKSVGQSVRELKKGFNLEADEKPASTDSIKKTDSSESTVSK
jgi:sec-independent protein translocase protein TatA